MEKDKEQIEEEINESHESQDLDDSKEDNIDEIKSEDIDEDAESEEENIKELIIAGMQTEVCIESTTKRAIELGYKIVLVEDGHSTFDFDDMNAIDEINRVNRELRPLVNLLKAENIELN